MPKAKVSIIMPVYGVEDYVGKAIESIQAQTFTDWEFFCVDDGTKDRSGEICDRYAEKDSRITVIHKENGGAPSARNAALDKVSGSYLYFLDSDDWVEPQMLADMVSLAEENDSQMVVAGFYIDTYYNDTEKLVQKLSAESAVYRAQAEFRENAYRLFDKNLLYTVWNKLYRADYILENKLYFPQTFWDDFPFNLNVIRDIDRVAVTSNAYYHFIRKRAESETAKYRSDMYDKREEENGWLEELYSYWNVTAAESYEFISRRYIERVIGCIENITNKSCGLTLREKRTEIRKMLVNERVKKALRLARPKSVYMKLMLIPIRLNNVTLTYLEGAVITRIKSGNTRLFARLKAHR